MLEASGFDALLNALIVGFAVMGGLMAGWSGAQAAWAHWTNKAVDAIAERVNRGLAVGFTVGAPVGIAMAMMTIW